MTLTPIWALGWETNSLLEGNAAGTLSPTISTTKSNTGSHSLRFGRTADADPYGRTVPSLTELQAAMAFNHNGIGTTSVDVVLFRLTAADATSFSVHWAGSDNTLRLQIGSTVEDTLAAAGSGISVVDTWYDVSVALKIGSLSGYFDFYGPDGSRLLHFSGDTGSSPIVAVRFGGRFSASSLGWNDFVYVDDCRCLDATGEGSKPASTRRYLWALANGNGQIDQWTGSDGDSTDNYQHVDDATPDGDSTYVKATSAGLVDQYTHASISVPADWLPVRVWPTVIGRKTDAGVDTTVQLGLWKAASDDDSAEISLPVSYDMRQAYFEALPDGSDMTESNINACELRLVSSGDYS